MRATQTEQYNKYRKNKIWQKKIKVTKSYVELQSWVLLLS